MAKPRANIGIIGATAVGKTTLTAAIATVLAKKYGDAATPAPSPSDSRADHVVAETTNRRYTLADWPSWDAFTTGIGYEQLDGAILVASVADGADDQTREAVRLAHVKAKVSYVIVFLNKCDRVDDADLIELVEMMVRELLGKEDLPGDDLPVVRGSAALALEGVVDDEYGVPSVLKVADALDGYIPIGS